MTLSLFSSEHSVNDQCKGPTGSEARGKVPLRNEYVVTDHSTVTEDGEQVRLSQTVGVCVWWRCAVWCVLL